jgi:hypothetical protein
MSMTEMNLAGEVKFELVRAGNPVPASAEALELASPVRALMNMRGRFKVEHIRDGEVIGQYAMPNGIVDVGLNSLLDVYFHNQTQIATWYIGLIDNAGFTALSNSDTMSSHTGWAESTAYDEATREEWLEGAAASRSITNSTPAEFTISATTTLKGIFVTSNSTKGGTTGTLWATAAFSSTVGVQDNDILRITYTVTG